MPNKKGKMMKKIKRTPPPSWSKGYEERGKWSLGDGPVFKKKLLNELARMTQHHCSFCDENLMGKQYSVEHFRPQIKFPLQTFEWENLFLSCPNCKVAKGIKFDEGLLKPDEDDYNFDKYFRIDFSTGILLPNSEESIENEERARITIDTFKLNGYDRPRARLKELRRYRDIDRYDASAIDDYSYRFFLKRGEKADLPKISLVLNISATISRINVEYITIHNVKCFEDVTINFNPEGNTTLILGTNARGKSLILQLLGLGLNDVRSVPFPQNWKKVVKTGNRAGTFEIGLKMLLHPSDFFPSVDGSPTHFKLKFQIDEDDTITCIESGDKDWPALKSQLLLIGYGVSRNVKLEEPHPYKDIETIATLFGENSYLKHIGASETFKCVNEHFDEIQRLINDVLDKADDKHKISLEAYNPDGFYFSTPSSPDELIPTEALSEGFKSTFVWLLDMIVRMVKADRDIEDLSEMRGIILLDEVDLHLHPTWQRRILPSLEKTFPNIQFIATTHSPFVAQSAERLIELELDETSNQVKVADKDAVSERSYNAIAREDFNIPSPFSHETEQEMNKFRKMRDAVMKEEKVDEEEFKKLVLKLAGKGVEIEEVMRREIMQLERHKREVF
ncbi:AAA family ATPase [Desulfobacterales bacterium HSG2]|nr:AAA family ATPase [Desulfobacterales bacterium HSG2]